MASPAAIWGEYLACGPLLIFVVISLDSKCSMNRVDWVLVNSLFLCLTAGFFILFPSSIVMGIFWLLVSCVTFLPSVFLPWYCHPGKIAKENTADDPILSVVQHTLVCRYHLAWTLSIMQSLFIVTYFITYFGLLTQAQTFAAYQILSVLTKGTFVCIAMV